MGALSSWRLVVAALGIALANVASAIPIVDTGASPYLEMSHPGVSVGTYQYVAGRFTTEETYEITNLAAFVRDYSCCGTHTWELTLSLMSGPADLANSTLTTLVSAATALTFENNSAGWASAAIDQYLLPAGTWWVVASVQPGQNGFGLGTPGGVPNPMDAYGFWSDETGVWQPLDAQLGGTFIPGTYGFRVDGDLVRVPEPSTGALLLLGVVMIWASKRKLTRKSI